MLRGSGIYSDRRELNVGRMRDLVRRLGVSLAITRWVLRPFRPT
jgi:hypothetical protein